jgi:hypothetical protein
MRLVVIPVHFQRRNYHQEGLKTGFRQTAFPVRRIIPTAKVEIWIWQTLAYAKEKYSQVFPGNPFIIFLDTFSIGNTKAIGNWANLFYFLPAPHHFVLFVGLWIGLLTASQRARKWNRKCSGPVLNIHTTLKGFSKISVIANLITVLRVEL